MDRNQLQAIVDAGDITALKAKIASKEVFLEKGFLLFPDEYEAYLEEKKHEDYNDMLQGVRKVLLNSSYGATLNEFCRFHDPRLGASTTGTGRQITTFMLETITEQLLGRKVVVQKHVEINKDGEVENSYTMDVPKDIGPVMADTDSCYFNMSGITNDPEEAIALADAIIKYINDCFPEFMQLAFNCQEDFHSLIKTNREIVARTGIIRAKKNYVFYVEDMEGRRITSDEDSKRLKLQGGDLKISSTPEVIRTFLKEVTMAVLKETPKKEIDQWVIDFRRKMLGNVNYNPLEFASTATAKTMDEYVMKWERIEKPGIGKVNIPSHIRASINFNSCLTMFNIKENPIVGGAKVKIVWLKKNDYNFKNIAFPSEIDTLPAWFKDYFEVDLKLTEQKMIDSKLGNTYNPIGWQVPTEQTVVINKLLSFDE